MFSQNIGQIFKQYRERIAMLQDIDEEQALAKALEDIKAEWKIWLGIWGSHEEDIHTSTQKIQSELDTLPEIKEEYADNVNKLHNMQACIKLSTSSGTYYESAQHTLLMDEIISTLIALHNDARRYGNQHANREFKEKLQILQEKYFSYFKEREQCRLFKAIVDNTVELLENLKNTPPISERAKQLIDNRIKYLSLCLFTFSPQGEFDNEKFQEEYYNETRSIIVELEHQDSVITQVKSALDNPLCPPTVKESTLKTLEVIESFPVSRDMISARLRLVQDAHDRVNREINAEAHAQETRNDIQLLSLRIQQIQTMQTAIMPAVPQNNVRVQAGENRQLPPPALPHEEHAKGYYRLLLQSYINRIATHKKHGQPDRINFAHGFIFFSKSRAINREINYRLAQRLLHRLEHQTIAQVFSGNMDAVRQEIIHENRMQARSHYLQSNLSHSELNNIVKSARRI